MIKDFLINLDERSHYPPEIDESPVTTETATYLISGIAKIIGENFYVAKFCFHDCFFIKFRYFGGYTDTLQTSEYLDKLLQ